MKRDVERIVDELAGSIGLDRDTEGGIRQELNDHFEDAVEEAIASGLPRDRALEQAIKRFGRPAAVRRGFRRAYSEVYLMTTIGKIIYSKPAMWTGLIMACLVALAALVWGGAGVYRLTQLPPSPTAWHDADSTPLFMVATALPMLVLFTGSVIRWIKSKTTPDKLVVWTAGLMVGLFILADLAVK